MTRSPRHLWIVAFEAPSISALPGTYDLPPVLAAAGAHRRLRGPYTAAGQVVRQIAPALLRSRPDVARRHDVELLAAAPELATSLPCRRATLTDLTSPTNRTRFHPGGRTTRLAHGLVEFLAEVVQLQGAPRTLVVSDADDADMTDLEWLGIMLRRTDPGACRILVHSRSTELPEPLGAALRRFADRLPVPSEPPVRARSDDPLSLATAYVAGDCTSPDPASVGAYESIDPATRAAMHDDRADELDALNQDSLRLGAVPYHREHGSDPSGAGADALLHAIEHCVLEGYYHSVVELAPRCFGVLDWTTRASDCWLVTAKMTTALTALDRPEEAEAYYDQACAATTLPSVHLQSAYGRAMLFTRFFTQDRRNHPKAKAWVNTAISLSSLLPEEQRRAFNVTFNENGLALVEMHLGDLDEALRLVEAGMARLDTEVDPGGHTQHRSVLAYNRAQLLVAMGALEPALTAYDGVIAEDPHHSEYYFERASVLRRLGRPDEAMRDYEVAIQESPPYPEPHYNRGDLAASLGDLQTAMAEFSYVLELDPTFVDAHINRATLQLQTGDADGAGTTVAAGLALRPDSAHLHSLRGLVALEQCDPGTARRALDRALALDPRLAEALANRAILRFDSGDTDGAIADLSAALEITDDPAIRENRALAYEASGRLAEAVADCERAMTHRDGDAESLSGLLTRCRAGLAVSA